MRTKFTPKKYFETLHTKTIIYSTFTQYNALDAGVDVETRQHEYMCTKKYTNDYIVLYTQKHNVAFIQQQ